MKTEIGLIPEIPPKVFFKIGEVADLLDVKPYVLRFWETEFPMIVPQKSKTGQRVYRRHDVELLFVVKHLLYVERFSIEGARKRIRELKKDGELKRGAIGQPQKKDPVRTRTLFRELAALAQKPATDFFKY